ncbi:MAG TPA: ATP-dependent DNA ligase, partial [Tepidisphaeraceae bacterium]|nr:ATP-dependent DNA ligase [Tepidisphaeraceae bacterium]
PAQSPAAPPRGALGHAPPLTLGDLSEAFEDLSRIGNAERKRELLHALFTRCAHPREAAYLAKIIFRDLRTGVQEGVLQAAIAQAFGRPLAAVQRCQLLVGDLDEVAVLAKHDALATPKFRLFHPIQFMLATPQETAAIAADTLAGRMFYAEDKLDGIRAQVHKQGDRIAIYTRTMDRTDDSFPDVVETIRHLGGDFLLDGEIVPYRDGVVLPFAHIQKRLGRKVLPAKILRDNPAAFIAFDILYRDGALLMDRPLRERRAALLSLAQVNDASPHASGVDAMTSKDAPRLLVSAATDVRTAIDIEAAFNKSRESRNEGLVLKDPDSIYSPGRRGKMWLKLKTYLPTFDCVVTAAEYGHGKRRNSLSDYTFAVWDREPSEDGATLVNVGKAYSGVTDEEIAQLTKLFLELSRGQWGRVHYVEPKVVLEIACDQIQKSARHQSGYALRFPRIKRVRWDKRPEEADRLARIVEIYESTHNFGRGSIDSTPAPEPSLFDKC